MMGATGPMEQVGHRFLSQRLTAHCLFGHGPQVQHDDSRRSRLSKSEWGVRQIGVAEVPDDACWENPLKQFSRLVQ